MRSTTGAQTGAKAGASTGATTGASTLPPFHLAFPTTDLAGTRRYLEEILGFQVGRTATRWVDFDMAGHQVTAHLVDSAADLPTNPVDGHAIPAFHFGLVLDWAAWETLADKLVAADTRFRVEPTIRFRGQPGEQGTFFIDVPGGVVMEFKTFRDHASLFAT